MTFLEVCGASARDGFESDLDLASFRRKYSVNAVILLPNGESEEVVNIEILKVNKVLITIS